MSVDLTDILARLDAYEAWAMQQAERGLQVVASAAQTTMQDTWAHGDQTGATRAGYRAYVVGAGDSGAETLADAVAAVDDKNPGHAVTAGGQLSQGNLGVVMTCPTDYQEKLEKEEAGKRAVLGPTMDAYRDELTARAARGG